MRKSWILGSLLSTMALVGCPMPTPTPDVQTTNPDVQGGADAQGDVQGVDVRVGTDVQGVDVRGVDVQGVDVQGVDVQGVDVQGVDVQGVDVQGVDVQGVDVQGVDVQRADVQGTDVRGEGGTTGAPLFANCASNAACASNTCLPAFPGGLCTVQCTRDAACGANGVCLLQGGATGICLPKCTPAGAIDLSSDPPPTPPADFGACVARPGFCTGVSQLDPTKGACVPTCWDATNTPPDPSFVCGAGLTCDSENSGCVAAPVTTGAITGGACPTGAADCRSQVCYPEQFTDMTTGMVEHTGFLQGSCISFARSIDQSELETFLTSGGTWPRGTCPPTGVPDFIFDVNNAFAFPQPTGEETLCFGRCSATSPCRGGYQCLSSGDFFDLTAFGGVDSSDGVCFPIDCTVAGATCPAGSTCNTTAKQCEAN